MRKIISACLLIAVLLSMAICAQAAGARMWFTSDSSFQVGGTASVDFYATAQSVIQAGDVTSEMYNAALEMNMSYSWICSNGPNKTGMSVTWQAADEGKEYICRVGFYSDSACTELVDYLDSAPFTVTAKQSLTFHTTELNDAIVGEPYYVQISSTDPNAEYSEFMGSELSDFGLTLHSNGIIDGTPTKAGNCHINIVATGPTGENSISYDLTVTEEFAPSVEVLDYPDQTTYMVGETFNPAGMRVKITTFDGSTMISTDGQYLDYYKEPLKNEGDVKIKLSHGDAFTFVYITVVPASGAGGAGDMPPAITLKSLPTAYVGEEYYVRIDCGDLDAEFWEYYNPGKPNDLSKTGLTLAKNGVLSGTPTKAGSYTFTICAGNDNGEDYATYTLTVQEKPAEPTEPNESVPDETEPVASTPVESEPDATEKETEKTDETDKTNKTNKTDKTTGKNQKDSGDDDDNGDNMTWLIVACVVIACLAVAVVVLVIILIKRKKSQ